LQISELILGSLIFDESLIMIKILVGLPFRT